jgi:hypothetical protein
MPAGGHPRRRPVQAIEGWPFVLLTTPWRCGIVRSRRASWGS